MTYRVQQLMQEINKVRLKNTRMEEQLGRVRQPHCNLFKPSGKCRRI